MMNSYIGSTVQEVQNPVRRGRRRSRRVSRGSSLMDPKKDMAVDSRQVSQIVRSIIGTRTEKKYFISFVNTTILNTGTVLAMSQIPQGTTDITRVGDRITLKRVDVICNIVAADATNFMRLMLVKYHPQSDPTSPPSINVFLNSVAGQGPASPPNHDTRLDYTVLDDRMIALTLSGMGCATFSFSKSLNFPLQFSGGSTTASNHLYLVAVSDSAAVSHPSLVYALKNWFTDS